MRSPYTTRTSCMQEGKQRHSFEAHHPLLFVNRCRIAAHEPQRRKRRSVALGPAQTGRSDFQDLPHLARDDESRTIIGRSQRQDPRFLRRGLRATSEPEYHSSKALKQSKFTPGVDDMGCPLVPGNSIFLVSAALVILAARPENSSGYGEDDRQA